MLAEHAGLDSVVALGPWIVASTSGPMDDRLGDSAFFESVGEATDLLIGKEYQCVGVSLGERILVVVRRSDERHTNPDSVAKVVDATRLLTSYLQHRLARVDQEANIPAQALFV